MNDAVQFAMRSSGVLRVSDIGFRPAPSAVSLVTTLGRIPWPSDIVDPLTAHMVHVQGCGVRPSRVNVAVMSRTCFKVNLGTVRPGINSDDFGSFGKDLVEFWARRNYFYIHDSNFFFLRGGPSKNE